MALIEIPTIARLRDIMLSRLLGSPGLSGVDTATGGFFWQLANALAETGRSYLVRARAMQEQMLPTTATGAPLLRWADALLQDPPYDATQWEGEIQFRTAIAGLPVVPIGQVCTHEDGTEYETTAAGSAWALVGAWYYSTATAEATEGGADANKAVTTPLTVSAPPAGVDSAAEIYATTNEGTDAETEAQIQRRIEMWLKERPGGGSCGDYRIWACDDSAVYDAFIYPRWNGGRTVYIVIVGPPGDRILTAPDVARVQIVINERTPLFATATVMLPQLTTQQVDITVRHAAGYGPDWDDTVFVANVTGVVAATRQITLNGHPNAAGLARGDRVVTHNADDTTTQHVIESAHDGAPGVGWVFVQDDWDVDPLAGQQMRAGGPLWAPVKGAVASAFDKVGTSIGNRALPDPERWPLVERESPSTLYLSDIYEAVEGVQGVVSSGIAQPAADVVSVTPAPNNPALIVFLGAGVVPDLIVRWEDTE